jgi:hypothetical protein
MEDAAVGFLPLLTTEHSSVFGDRGPTHRRGRHGDKKQGQGQRQGGGALEPHKAAGGPGGKGGSVGGIGGEEEGVHEEELEASGLEVVFETRQQEWEGLGGALGASSMTAQGVDEIEGLGLEGEGVNGQWDEELGGQGAGGGGSSPEGAASEEEKVARQYEEGLAKRARARARSILRFEIYAEHIDIDAWYQVRRLGGCRAGAGVVCLGGANTVQIRM